jgi:hypothetical protein
MGEFAMFLAIAIGMPTLFIVGVPPIAKAFARRLERTGGVDQEMAAEVDALRAEVEALRAIVPRVVELEERMDFSERLLTREREPERLEG